VLDENQKTAIDREELYKNFLELQKHIDSNNLASTAQLTVLTGLTIND